LAERQRQLEAREEPKYNPTDRHKGSEYQAKADEAYQMHGRQAPAQREGESAETYRRRLLTGLQVYHPEFKDIDLHSAPQIVMNNFEKEIMQAALSPNSHKADVPPGVIKEIRMKDPVTGRDRFEFVSSDANTTFIHLMARPRQIIARMLGVDRIGGPLNPVENPERMGRMPLRGGFPR
jgi:hypothetical protein